MYLFLLSSHSIFRWLVLISLIYCIYIGYKGWFGNLVFTKKNNSLRHITATIAHVQLIIGFSLYMQSPIVKAFLANFKSSIQSYSELSFFGFIHILLMNISIIIITIGSALAKRAETDKDKFKTMAIWFSVALLIIFIAIPWPFSPLANRPILRMF